MIVTSSKTVMGDVNKTVIVPITTETTTASRVNTTTDSKVSTETTYLSKINTVVQSNMRHATLTRATVTGYAYDATLAENIANKTDNDGIAELNEYYYTMVDAATVDSDTIDYETITTMTDGIEQKDISYDVENVIEITIDTPVETVVNEEISVLVTSTALAD